MTTKLSYTEQKLDDTGLLYYNARYYDPSLAKFISPDTLVPGILGSQNFNRYSYVTNNPLNRTDPSGHCANDALGNRDDANDRECWQAYDQAVRDRNWQGNASALTGFDTGKLRNLLIWLKRGVIFIGANWNTLAVDKVMQGLDRVHNALKNQFGEGQVENKLNSILGLSGGLTFKLTAMPYLGLVGSGSNEVALNEKQYTGTETPANQNNAEQLIEGVVHELGHIFDRNIAKNGTFWTQSSSTWVNGTGWVCDESGRRNCAYSERKKSQGDVASMYAKDNPADDFAETFVWWISNVNNSWAGSNSTRTDSGTKPNQQRRDILDKQLGI